MEGVVLSLNNRTVDVGEVVVRVEDIVDAIPPGTREYEVEAGVLDPNGTSATVMFNTTA